MNCSHNLITNLDNLPNQLTELCCSYNKILQLSNLPRQLSKLSCVYNPITQLLNLPDQLVKLDYPVSQRKNLKLIKNQYPNLRINC